MARQQRIAFENAYYHVMHRGAGRENIFCDEKDRHIFLDTWSEACEQYKIEVHAYCLMDNHYHFLIKTPFANISRAMRHVNGVYTQRFNRRHATDGALFRGRYKAILVDSDAYLLHLTKYIHLNPLSAKMVECLEDYPWSSYPAYINKEPPKKWLFRDEVYMQLTESSDKAHHYERFILDSALKNEIAAFYKQPHLAPILGSDDFISSLKIKKPSKEIPQSKRVYHRPTMTEIVLTVSKILGEQPENLLLVKRGPKQCNIGRKVAMYVARKYGDYQLQEIANMFNLASYGGVSAAIHGFTKSIEKEPALQAMINQVMNQLQE